MGTEWDPQFVWDEVFRPSAQPECEACGVPLVPGRVEAAVRLDLNRLLDQGSLDGLEPSMAALAISLAGRVDAGDSVYSTSTELRKVLTLLHSDVTPQKVTTPNDDDDLSSPT